MFGALRVSGRTEALTLRNVLKATQCTHSHIYKNTHSKYKARNKSVGIATKNNAILLYQIN